MGVVLDPTPEMEGYRVEARRESFYLYSPPDLRFRVTQEGFAFPAGDRAAVRAALEQMRTWLDDPATVTDDYTTVHEELPVWRDGEEILVRGDAGWLVVYGCDQPRTSALEVVYSHLDALRSALSRVS
ncbi:hypothetical protein [Actinomadura miaoliensis]|uniref:Uncharacterized protein n=1 Tax=Actinomadura miaoliensis TaxID=430685 RepID=A0ABP7W8B0_9ACTN